MRTAGHGERRGGSRNGAISLMQDKAGKCQEDVLTAHGPQPAASSSARAVISGRRLSGLLAARSVGRGRNALSRPPKRRTIAPITRESGEIGLCVVTRAARAAITAIPNGREAVPSLL